MSEYDEPPARGANSVQELFQHGTQELSKILAGQRELIEQALVALLAGGHALIEGVPGVAKTLAVKSLAKWLALDYRRIQGTADMMPADITGTNVFLPARNEFSFHKGPAFTQFLLADEVNRMPPRTQAALLECMEERQITADGVRHTLDPYFTVFATQNPVEFEGTYPLPEAQLDRFLLKIRIGYPSEREELTVLERHHTAAGPLDQIAISSIDPAWVAAGRAEVRAVKAEEQVLQYLLSVVRRTRSWPAISLGASPRAAVALLITAKAYAAKDGRDYLLPDDVKSAAMPCLRHRLQLKPEAELEGLDADRVLADVLTASPVPK
ncbi:AAA family ATPase [Tunturiibacter gelidiferens]|uniref:AAA family ATPase n=1 Tax=Tunturiibacter gelidiferens TaxID=3069689 RepID=UPI003D9BCBD1